MLDFIVFCHGLVYHHVYWPDYTVISNVIPCRVCLVCEAIQGSQVLPVVEVRLDHRESEVSRDCQDRREKAVTPVCSVCLVLKEILDYLVTLVLLDRKV